METQTTPYIMTDLLDIFMFVTAQGLTESLHMKLLANVGKRIQKKSITQTVISSLYFSHIFLTTGPVPKEHERCFL